MSSQEATPEPQQQLEVKKGLSPQETKEA